MTPAEKAALLDQYEGPVAAECAAHFRALVPDSNGLLPCPMCAAGRGHILPERYKGMVWYRARCIACGLLTVRKCTKLDAIAAWNRRGGVAYE